MKGSVLGSSPTRKPGTIKDQERTERPKRGHKPTHGNMPEPGTEREHTTQSRFHFSPLRPVLGSAPFVSEPRHGGSHEERAQRAQNTLPSLRELALAVGIQLESPSSCVFGSTQRETRGALRSYVDGEHSVPKKEGHTNERHSVTQTPQPGERTFLDRLLVPLLTVRCCNDEVEHGAKGVIVEGQETDPTELSR